MANVSSSNSESSSSLFSSVSPFPLPFSSLLSPSFLSGSFGWDSLVSEPSSPSLSVIFSETNAPVSLRFSSDELFSSLLSDSVFSPVLPSELLSSTGFSSTSPSSLTGLSKSSFLYLSKRFTGFS